MTYHAFLRFWLIMSTVLTISACKFDKKSKDHSHDHKQWKHVHIKGDVDSLIAGTKLNSESIFSEENLEYFSGFSLAQAHLFSEQVTYESSNESGKGTDHHPDENLFDTKNYRFERVDENTIAYRSPDDAFFATLELKRKGAKFVPVRLYTKHEDFHFEKVVHYSLKNDGNAFSILAEFTDESLRRTLISIVFIRNPDPLPKTPEFVRDDFSYLLGYSRGIPWRDSVNFEICGDLALDHEEIIRDSIHAWDVDWPSGYIGGLGYTITANPNPPPFSDLNHNCIYFVEAYDFGYFDSDVTLGLATYVLDLNRSKILQASSFIAASAHDLVNIPIKTTIIHEIGHMLGLGHEFTKNDEEETKFPSVMGYDGVGFVTERDRSAIRALYRMPTQLDSSFIDLTDRVEVNTPDLNDDIVSVQHFLISDHPVFRNHVSSIGITFKNLSGNIICLADLEIVVTDSTGKEVFSSDSLSVLSDLNLISEDRSVIKSSCLAPYGQAFAYLGQDELPKKLTAFDFHSVNISVNSEMSLETGSFEILEELEIELQIRDYFQVGQQHGYEVRITITNLSELALSNETEIFIVGLDKYGRFNPVQVQSRYFRAYSTDDIEVRLKSYFQDAVDIKVFIAPVFHKN